LKTKNSGCITTVNTPGPHHANNHADILSALSADTPIVSADLQKADLKFCRNQWRNSSLIKNCLKTAFFLLVSTLLLIVPVKCYIGPGICSGPEKGTSWRI
jgi:hypothetical protein